MNAKPIGGKNYGSIAHLPGSRMGPADHKCHDGQERICLVQKRDKHDTIIVQEKLDGSNVGVAKVNGQIVALTRAGYVASTSPYEQHHKFGEWVELNKSRFDILREGERLVGEWLLQAHGTRYALPHEPFVVFDLIRKGMKREPFAVLQHAVRDRFVLPHTVSIGEPVSIEDAMLALGEYGKHGALDPIEGAMWRVERNELISPRDGGERRVVVDFLAKYVRPDKADGTYLESVTGGPAVLNTWGAQ